VAVAVALLVMVVAGAELAVSARLLDFLFLLGLQSPLLLVVVVQAEQQIM
jgi:hypothetical protein